MNIKDIDERCDGVVVSALSSLQEGSGSKHSWGHLGTPVSSHTSKNKLHRLILNCPYGVDVCVNVSIDVTL